MSTVSMPSSITYSTLSALTAFAGSSIDQWTSLTPDRISQLIQQIQGQIDTDTATIGQLRGQIADYDRQINVNPNYQSSFNEADFRYTSTLQQYINVSTSIQQALSSLVIENSLLSTYSTTAANYRSTLDSLRNTYNTLLSTSLSSISMIDVEQSTLATLVKSYADNSTICSNLNASYSGLVSQYITVSTISTPIIVSLDAAFINQTSVAASLQASMAIATENSRPPRSTLSTQLNSTNSAIALLDSRKTDLANAVARVFLSTATASTTIAQCPQILNSLSTQVSASSERLQRYIAISTTFVVGSDSYWSTINHWSTMERQALSSIAAFEQQKRDLITQRDDLNTQIGGLKTDLRNALNTLDVNAAAFYSTKRVQMVNEVLEFKNASAQLSAYMGMLSAEYMIRRLDLFDDIDTATFQRQNAIQTGNTVLRTTLDTAIAGYQTDQNNLLTEVTNVNKLESKFIELGTVYDDEIALKNQFLTARSTMYIYERGVIANPASRPSIQTDYQTKWQEITATIGNINNKITGSGGRKLRWENDLKPTISNIYTNWSAYSTKYPGKFTNFPTDLLNYNFTYLQVNDQLDTNKNTYMASSDYAILPAIDFTAPIPNYSL